jgi:hypothetical protein
VRALEWLLLLKGEGDHVIAFWELQEETDDDKMGQIKTAEPAHHHGTGARAAPFLLLRDGIDVRGNRAAASRRRFLLE